ncbi:MAG: DegV family protein [Chloroflexi bacterium]|nr:DegV family protein [Chloroflexota bacterium]
MSNRKIAVVTDSTAYIPAQALGDLDIPIIPLWLIWGDERFRDGVDIDPPTFYRRLREAKTLPTTSQPSAGEFVDFFRRVAAENDTDTIVGAYISSGISGTVASAEAAKAQVPELDITIIDSLFASMGLGFVALAAARVAAAGGSLKKIIAAAEETRDGINLLLTVDTLEYLHRGGRIGGGKRFLGTALKIKPLLHLEDGRIEALTQVRTKRKAIAQMLDIVEERLGGRQMAEVSILDADSPEEGKAVAERVTERFGISTVYCAMVSPVIGTHVGPGTIGITFYPAAPD